MNLNVAKPRTRQIRSIQHHRRPVFCDRLRLKFFSSNADKREKGLKKKSLDRKERSLYLMHSIGHIPHHYPHRIHHPSQFQNQAASAGGSSSLSQMEKATLFQSQETDLTIVTKEGDYVTISADSDFRLDFSTYDSTGRMKGATSQFAF